MSLTDGWHTLRGRLNELLPRGSLRGRFARGAFWSVFGMLIAQALQFAASVSVVRILGKELYGEFGMIRSTVQMFGVFAGLALGLTATRYVARWRTEDRTRAGEVITFTSAVALLSAGAVTLVLFLTAPLLARETLQAPHLAAQLRIGCLLIFLEVMDGVFVGGLAGLEAFKLLAKVRLVRGLLTFPVMVTGVWFWGLTGAVTALVIVTGCACVMDLVMLLRKARREGIPIGFGGVRRQMSIWWEFTLPASMSGFLIGPALWAGNTLLVRQPEGYASLGVFDAANILRRVVIMIGMPIGSVLLPILSSREGANSRLFQKTNLLATWMIGMLIAAPLICFPEVVGWLFGRDVSGNVFNRTLVLVLLAAVVYAYNEGLSRVLIARNLMWWGFVSNLCWTTLFIGVMLVGRFYGSIGLATGYVVSYGVNTMVFMPLFVRRRLVPRELLWSWNVLALWLGLAGAAVASWYGPSWLLRVPMALVLVAVIAFFVRRILRVRVVSATVPTVVGDWTGERDVP